MLAKILSKFVSITHSALWMNFIIHAPLAVVIVLLFKSWVAFFVAATIGLWKDVWLDQEFGDGTTTEAAWLAACFYLLGAIVGAFGSGLL